MLCEGGKTKRKANAADGVVAAVNTDERVVLHRVHVSRRFTIGFLLNTAFNSSYALSFVSPVRDTRRLPGYFFPSSYIPSVLCVKSQLNSVAITIKFHECEIIDEQREQAVRSFGMPSLIHEVSDTKKICS